MKAWWASLQERERRLLTVLGVLAAALLWWLMLLRPLEAARSSAQAAVATLNQQRGEARAQADAILASRHAAAPRPVRSLFALIDSSARDAGLMNAQTRIEPLAENRVRVIMDGTDFDRLSTWLETLDRDEGIDISEWSVDRALVPGVVNATMTLETSR
ncbi:MAG: type II secretion system protein M [Rhodanobacteraceae bacterium]|nr:type II secretion system protein M [Rhodanobacteraceae bacterium]